MNFARLVGFATRRALGSGVWIALGFVVLLGCGLDWSGATGLPSGDAPVLRGLERRALWLAWLGCVGSIALVRAARAHAAWREHEFDWIAALPLARRRWLAATWLGDALALFVLAACGCLAIEFAVGDARPTERVLRMVELPPVALVETHARVEWTLDDAPVSGRARLELALAGGGRAAEVRWIAKRGELATATAATIGLRTTLGLELPPADVEARAATDGESGANAQPVAFVLERLAPGAIVVADPGGLLLTQPVESDRAASLWIASRAWLALCAADALALGFGAWVSSASAFGLAFGVWLAAWFALRVEPLVPASDLFGALAHVGAGLVPTAPVLANVVGAGLLVVFGLELGARRPWTRQP
ncbi:MAG: hypothetical protein L6Q99_09565 [Planctomycetes bacterium]|nr:hypothetical protein [Planctomycetota bacterium]